MKITALLILLLLVAIGLLVVRVIRYGWNAVQIFGKDAPDAGDDWLAKQVREEQRARAFLEREGLKVRMEHFENCDAGKLRLEHEKSCDAAKVRRDVRRVRTRKK